MIGKGVVVVDGRSPVVVVSVNAEGSSVVEYSGRSSSTPIAAEMLK